MPGPDNEGLPLHSELRLFNAFHVPELKLWLLPPDAPSWHAPDPAALGMPYWAFTWPGGAALARYVLDHPSVVRGKRVLDFGSGCAIEGLAALRAGAAEVLCADIDPHASRAAERNARENGLTVRTTTDDLIGTRVDADIVLVGDVCYDQTISARLVPWLRSLSATVLIGDPLRVPGALDGCALLAHYDCSFDGDPRGLTTWRTSVLSLAR